ncbi:hypothetical protein BaRGS_00026838 [Batillaria attramentaria]|uniref:EGF-like domain-containing protein n=1 Tax=Batillaria attramentaria TaxID=370345 RepID=A0ABD0K4V9_9CAEN
MCLSQGCKAGYWGDQCDKTCNRRCVNGTCNRDDGQCQCAPGWREPSCAGEELCVTILTTAKTVAETVAVVLVVSPVTTSLVAVRHVNPAISHLCVKTVSNNKLAG